MNSHIFGSGSINFFFESEFIIFLTVSDPWILEGKNLSTARGDLAM